MKNHSPQAYELLEWFETNWNAERELSIDQMIPEHLRPWLSYCQVEHLIWPHMLRVTDLGRLALKQRTNQPTQKEGCETQEQTQVETKPSNRGKKVNARMLEKMQMDMNGNKESHGWNSTKWASYLGCKPASVVVTQTWKALEPIRAAQKAERARDRRGRGTRRKKGGYGQD